MIWNRETMLICTFLAPVKDKSEENASPEAKKMAVTRRQSKKSPFKPKSLMKALSQHAQRSIEVVEVAMRKVHISKSMVMKDERLCDFIFSFSAS